MERESFVRVVQRRGWDVELLDPRNLGQPETSNFEERGEALEYAMAQQPDWIELGEVVQASNDVPQHHRWTTLRRQSDGKYASAALVWGGGSKRPHGSSTPSAQD